MACEIHLEQNCRQQMRVLGIKKQTMDGIIVDIFGEEDVAMRTRYGGIADSRDTEEFERQVNAVKERWDFLEHVETKKTPKFWEWFYRSETFFIVGYDRNFWRIQLYLETNGIRFVTTTWPQFEKCCLLMVYPHVLRITVWRR